MTDPDRWLEVHLVAKRLGYSDEQVRRMIRGGELPAVRRGHRGNWRVSEQVLTRYMQSTATTRNNSY